MKPVGHKQKVGALAGGGNVVCGKAGNKAFLHVPKQCHTQERHRHLTEPLNIAPLMCQNGCLMTDISLVVCKLVIHDFIYFLLLGFSLHSSRNKSKVH